VTRRGDLLGANRYRGVVVSRVLELVAAPVDTTSPFLDWLVVALTLVTPSQAGSRRWNVLTRRSGLRGTPRGVVARPRLVTVIARHLEHVVQPADTRAGRTGRVAEGECRCVMVCVSGRRQARLLQLSWPGRRRKKEIPCRHNRQRHPGRHTTATAYTSRSGSPASALSWGEMATKKTHRKPGVGYGPKHGYARRLQPPREAGGGGGGGDFRSRSAVTSGTTRRSHGAGLIDDETPTGPAVSAAGREQHAATPLPKRVVVKSGGGRHVRPHTHGPSRTASGANGRSQLTGS